MALDTVSFVYGVNDCKIAKLLTDANPPTYDTLVDVPGITEVGVSFKMDSKKLKGDETTIDQRTKIEAIELKVEHAQVSLDAMAVLLGGTVTSSGTTPNVVQTYAQGAGTPNDFKLICKVDTVDVDAADMHFVAYKCKVTAFDEGAKGEDYRTVSFTAEAVPCANAAAYFYDQIMHETAADIS